MRRCGCLLYVLQCHCHHTIAASFQAGTIPTIIIIDNRDAQTSQTGTWPVSGAAGILTVSILFTVATEQPLHLRFIPPQSGIYDVSMWWTKWSSRSSNVPVDIENNDGVLTVYIDQQVNGGQWNSQGQYYFESATTYDITITSQPGPSSTCADAVRFVLSDRHQLTPLPPRQRGNGTITPSGTVTVNDGDDQTFDISPDAGYHLRRQRSDRRFARECGSLIYVPKCHGESYHRRLPLRLIRVRPTSLPPRQGQTAPSRLPELSRSTMEI